MEEYRRLSDGSIGDVAETLRDIIRKRDDDIQDFQNSQNSVNIGLGVLFVEGNSLKFRDAAGTVTTIVP